MKLILVRHAEAVELGADGVATDFDRPLTELGRRQASALAAALKARGVQPQAILTSPLVRAVQTAEPLAAELTPGTPAAVNDWLVIGELRPKKLTRAAAEVGSVVVLVGHQPDMGEYLEWLLGPAGDNIKFAKAAAACVAVGGDAQAGSGVLEWFVTPLWFMPS
jgi:phosphohistidine phosphatase